MKKILITGAAGFIGSNLVNALLKDGISYKKLRLLVFPGESLTNLPKMDFDIVWGDIRDKKFIAKVVEDVETIYHLAARIGFDGNVYNDYKDINVIGTKNLLEAVKNNKIQKFVFFSTVAIYGLTADVGNIENWNEDHRKGYKEIYGQSKWEAEQEVINAYNKYKIPYVIIRPTSVYGPGDYKNLLPLYKAIKKDYFFLIGNGKNKLDYVYVGDLVRGVIQAQRSKITHGDYILGAGRGETLNEIVDCIAVSIHKKNRFIRVPKSVGYLASFLVECINILFKTKLPLYPKRVRSMTSNFYFDIAKAKKEIGYQPRTSFRIGAKIMASWLINKELL